MGSRNYTSTIDIWSIGCIMAEMSNGRPLFPGSSVRDQLLRIYQTLGTPTEERWPKISEIPDYKPILPIYPAIDLSLALPKLQGDGIDLLLNMLEYAPEKRISAEQALSHRFFKDLQPVSVQP